MRERLRLLMTTQTVDLEHPIVGFSHTWISKIAERTKRLYVLTMRSGVQRLSSNVEVHSLGRDRGRGRLSSAIAHMKYVRGLVREGRVDGIFVQQAQINAILAAPFALPAGIPMILFKAHSRSLNTSLKIANRLISLAVTSAPAAYPIDTPKKVVIGQGIDTEYFRPARSVEDDGGRRLRIVAVGRVSPIKRYEVIIEAARMVAASPLGGRIEYRVFGEIADSSRSYYERLQRMIQDCGLAEVFRFEGPVPYEAVAAVHQSADLLIHPCDTESLDKVVLEAMACAVPVVTSIQSYRDVLGSYANDMVVPRDDAAAMAQAAVRILSMPPDERRALGNELRTIVVREHSVEHLADRIVGLFEDLTQHRRVKARTWREERETSATPGS